ncbi:two-component system regulatory protein YycI [Lacrimispora sp. NSJ-141]|uniref:Two-component system regulatory protein YycI n=1 Tax=Lientehia hominis TaxID=2897778 RepID=A0AAP2RI66_9FIRM|nr:two-component system regulatory protein YycI [Lientehia hominis]MCD2492186.1 two-component system regulatory protein YycI [Lientehia hominis]
MKRRKAMFMIAITVLCLSACGRADSEQVESSSDSQFRQSPKTNGNEIGTEKLSWDNERICLEISEGVSMDAEVVIPDTIRETVEKCHVKDIHFNGKEVAFRLFPEIEKNKWEFLDYSDLGVDSQVSFEGKFSLPLTKKEMSGSAMIGLELNFHTEHWMKCEANLPLIFTSSSDIEVKEDLSGDLAFESRDAVVRKVSEYLQNDIGLEIKPINSYSIDYRKMEEQEEINKRDGGEELKDPGDQNWTWSAEDDCYYLTFEQYINGLPMLIDNYAGQDGNGTRTGEVRVGYTVNGIESISCLGNFAVTEREKMKLAQPEDIVNTLKKKYELILTNDITITQMKLIYFPYPISNKEWEYDFIPTWRVTYKQSDGDRYFYIDAVTGEEVNY